MGWTPLSGSNTVLQTTAPKGQDTKRESKVQGNQPPYERESVGSGRPETMSWCEELRRDGVEGLASEPDEFWACVDGRMSHGDV
jgi:hypothetical protein